MTKTTMSSASSNGGRNDDDNNVGNNNESSSSSPPPRRPDSPTPLWESSKENAAPLERGRNVRVLERSFRQTVDTPQERLEKERLIRHYERLVRPSEVSETQSDGTTTATGPSNNNNNDDDDPLIHWLSYIKFHQDAFPSDTNAQFLLMERCTRALMGRNYRAQYANDVRFIRVCVMYADKTSFPSDVFKHLYQHGVGLGTALFWMAWSWVAETSGDYDFALRIFQKGLSTKYHVQPLQQLQQRYKQFQRRFAKHVLQQQQELDGGGAGEEDYEYGRGALHGLTEERVRRNDRAVVVGSVGGGIGDENTRPGTSVVVGRHDASAQRSSNRQQTQQRHHGHNRPPSSSTARNTTATFDVFVDNESPASLLLHHNDNDDNDDANQEDEFVIHGPLERNVDRHKENTEAMAAERWNERGGLHNTTTTSSTNSVAARSTTTTTRRRHPTHGQQPSSSFAIYIDEECTAQMEHEEQQQRLDDERSRQIRDERTLQQRTDADIAEKLARDPMRYVRNPSKLVADEQQQQESGRRHNHRSYEPHETHHHNQTDDIPHENRGDGTSKFTTRNNKKSPSLRCGFDKRLVGKDDEGQELCFEEGRAAAFVRRASDDGSRCVFQRGYTGPFFNLLAAPATMTSTGSSTTATIASKTEDMDVSMGDSLQGDDVVEDKEDGKLPTAAELRHRRSLNKTMAVPKALFANDVADESLDNYSRCSNSNANNVSTASSTIHERDAVGAPTTKDEETINTKFAVKELSMMFCSPALGLNGELESALEQDNNDNGDGDGGTASFSLVEGLVDESSANNSILASSRDNSATAYDDHGDARDATMAELHQSALGAMVRDDHGAVVAKGTESSSAAATHRPSTTASGFSIFCDDDTADNEDNRQSVGDTATFSILGEALQPSGDPASATNGDDRTASFQVYDDTKRDSGDTATLSVLGEALKAAPATVTASSTSTPPVSIDHDDDCGTRDSGGDTATFSVLGETFKNLETSNAQAECGHKAGFSIYADDDNNSIQSTRTDAIFSSTKYRSQQGADSPPGFGDISRIIDADDGDMPSIRRVRKPRELDDDILTEKAALDYTKFHKDDVRSALRQVQILAQDTVMRRHRDLDLTRVLATRGYVDDMPTQSMPRALLLSRSAKGAKIAIGDRVGFVKEELGRGTYGTVILLESKDEVDVGVVAVKAQAPTDCLALEYVILQAVEERVGPFCEAAAPFPFPKALSFLSLANGGLLGMTNVSQSGINLVDLVNVYKVLEGTSVPELIVLHYTIRMLKHIELLHWRGNILHCDVKPDNWVLSPSSSAFDGCTEEINASDLTLVDFGRAVDLRAAAVNGDDPMDVLLKGEPAEEDMSCVAMRKGLSWSFDADTFGICASSHVLLYGTHMDCFFDSSTKRWKPRKPLRRYWQKDLWNELFDTLLNLDEVSRTAFGSRPGSLRDLRKKFEAHMQGRTSELLSLLKHQDRILPPCRIK